MSKHLIAPSILSADFANLQSEVEMINGSDADWFHIDVMDGVFVPNLTFGMPIIKAIKKHANKPFDVHLMMVNPDQYIHQFADAGADILTVHYEACTHLHRTIQAIKAAGMKASVALNPHTSITMLEHVIHELDMVLIMSVNPGFGGQQFIPITYQKIKELKHLIDEKKSNALIQVDGGVTDKNIKELVDAGANVLVAGSYVFKHASPKEAIKTLKSA